MDQQVATTNGVTGDEDLVRRVQQGEVEVFGQLAERHHKSVYWVIEGILHNQADSEEVLQEAFLKAFDHIKDFRGDSKFATWLIRIAINEAHMRLRKYKPGRYESLDEEPDGDREFRPREISDWRPNPEQTFAKEELGRLLDQGIQSLPSIYRQIFLLRDVKHLSTEEAAEALGLTIPAAKTRLLRARLMMREYLAPHFKTGWNVRLPGNIDSLGRMIS